LTIQASAARAGKNTDFYESMQAGFMRGQAVKFGANVSHAAGNYHATYLGGGLACLHDAHHAQGPTRHGHGVAGIDGQGPEHMAALVAGASQACYAGLK
jgi:hypothetical protein